MARFYVWAQQWRWSLKEENRVQRVLLEKKICPVSCISQTKGAAVRNICSSRQHEPACLNKLSTHQARAKWFPATLIFLKLVLFGKGNGSVSEGISKEESNSSFSEWSITLVRYWRGGTRGCNHYQPPARDLSPRWVYASCGHPGINSQCLVQL